LVSRQPDHLDLSLSDRVSNAKRGAAERLPPSKIRDELHFRCPRFFRLYHLHRLTIQKRETRINILAAVIKTHFPRFPNRFTDGVNHPVADGFFFGMTGADMLAHYVHSKLCLDVSNIVNHKKLAACHFRQSKLRDMIF